MKLVYMTFRLSIAIRRKYMTGFGIGMIESREGLSYEAEKTLLSFFEEYEVGEVHH
jgi:hypothetical protein